VSVSQLAVIFTRWLYSTSAAGESIEIRRIRVELKIPGQLLVILELIVAQYLLLMPPISTSWVIYASLLPDPYVLGCRSARLSGKSFAAGKWLVIYQICQYIFKSYECRRTRLNDRELGIRVALCADAKTLCYPVTTWLPGGVDEGDR
jgi:hypothetical protein